MDNEFINNLERTFYDIFDEIYSNKITYDPNNQYEMTALGYYSRILEGAKAIILLLKENDVESAIQPIFRSILEAFIDLDNINNIEGYIYYLRYLDLQNRIDLGDKYYFKQLCEEEKINYKETYNRIKKDRLQLEDKIKSEYGKTFLNNNREIKKGIKFRFYLAKDKETYDSLYWILCTDTHNNITSLNKSYLTSTNSQLIVDFFKDMDSRKEKIICEKVESILKRSQKNIYDILNLK